ncbi:Ethanolamine ammonia-lyase light chain [Thalassocella blandensis]|nr:Ethanolamine ammonia-lyase light chain [Thalassocella blandensis]
MNRDNPSGRIENSWKTLNRFTSARIGLGRAGVSQTTQHQLAFQLAHACAQDAVSRPMQWQGIHQTAFELQLSQLHLHSQAQTRDIYLQRPDLGRQLSQASEEEIQRWKSKYTGAHRCVLVVADGLSSTGVEQHVPSLLRALTSRLAESRHALSPSLLCTVEQGRVAIGDVVAALTDAMFLVVIIGERPGLSSPDSLGIYFTYQAGRGVTDADRNCISNIRPAGLGFDDAAKRLLWLMDSAAVRKTSGVELKDDSGEDNRFSPSDAGKNFLIPQ